MRTEIEEALLELRARNTVLEAVQTQLMLRLAGLFDRPEEFIRTVMMHAEKNLRSARQQAGGEDKPIADAAVAVMDNYSLQLIAALTPRGKAQ